MKRIGIIDDLSDHLSDEGAEYPSNNDGKHFHRSRLNFDIFAGACYNGFQCPSIPPSPPIVFSMFSCIFLFTLNLDINYIYKTIYNFSQLLSKNYT